MREVIDQGAAACCSKSDMGHVWVKVASCSLIHGWVPELGGTDVNHNSQSRSDNASSKPWTPREIGPCGLNHAPHAGWWSSGWACNVQHMTCMVAVEVIQYWHRHRWHMQLLSYNVATQQACQCGCIVADRGIRIE